MRVIILSACIFAACESRLPELGQSDVYCGDSVVQGDEVCDDGNDLNRDACTTACQLARCGDGYVQAGEACDDGNINDRDGCTNACVSLTILKHRSWSV